MNVAGRKLISVVTPCYNEELNILDCHEAVRKLFAERLPEYDYEHIFCDNASRDSSPQILADLAARDERVRVIFNAANFGPFRSMFNGLQSTSGDAVVVQLAADLQDPPELIVDFVRRWEEGYEVVYGKRSEREEGLAMRTVRHVYYRAVNRFAEINVPTDVSEFQLIDRAVADAVCQFDDYYPYIRGMIAYCGFRAVGVPSVWKARKKGFSKNRLYHLIDQGLNGLISLSNVPMRLCMLLGSGLACCTIVYALVNLVIGLVYYRQLASPGIQSIIVSLFFFMGVILFFLGVLGEYISAIHAQVRRKPSVVERGRLNFPAVDGAPSRKLTRPGFAAIAAESKRAA